MRENTVLGVRRAALATGLREGASVQIAYKIMLKTGKYYTKTVRNALVLALYPHHFVCEVDGFRVSFRYNEVVGDESTKITVL